MHWLCLTQACCVFSSTSISICHYPTHVLHGACRVGLRTSLRMRQEAVAAIHAKVSELLGRHYYAYCMPTQYHSKRWRQIGW